MIVRCRGKELSTGNPEARSLGSKGGKARAEKLSKTGKKTNRPESRSFCRIKIKNPNYSQAEGRREMIEKER